MYKRKAAKLRAQKLAEPKEDDELKLVVKLIGIAAQYIQTEDILTFSNEVRTFLDERQKTEIKK
jgi:hypothetical protein